MSLTFFNSVALLLTCLVGGVGGSLLDLEAVEAEVAGYEDTVP